MTRYERLISMSKVEWAKYIIKHTDLDKYFCHMNCGFDDDCPHPIDCVLWWLDEEVK